MKITKENAVSVKNMYFCVTVFLVQFVLALIVFSIMAIVKMTIFKNVPEEELYFVMTPIQIGVNILIWYIAGKVGIYNIFSSQKIAKKNLLPLRKAVIKDWSIFIAMMVLFSLSNIVNLIVVLIALFINLPLLKKNFDKQVALHYGNITFE